MKQTLLWALPYRAIMDDLDVPWKSNFTHWVIWNIPAMAQIPEGIAHGETVQELDGAVQEVAWCNGRTYSAIWDFDRLVSARSELIRYEKKGVFINANKRITQPCIGSAST